jgi:hypothetical protein
LRRGRLRPSLEFVMAVLDTAIRERGKITGPSPVMTKNIEAFAGMTKTAECCIITKHRILFRHGKADFGL